MTCCNAMQGQRVVPAYFSRKQSLLSGLIDSVSPRHNKSHMLGSGSTCQSLSPGQYQLQRTLLQRLIHIIGSLYMEFLVRPPGLHFIIPFSSVFVKSSSKITINYTSGWTWVSRILSKTEEDAMLNPHKI